MLRIDWLVTLVLVASLGALGCGDDSGGNGGDGGAGGTAGSAGSGGAGGGELCEAGFGGAPAVDCDSLPDPTGYAVGDYFEVPATPTDDCDETLSGADVNANNLNVVLDGADPGEVFCIAPGTYDLDATITIAAVPGLTVKGTGDSPDDTVLNFGGPGTGKGILVQQDDTTIENMWVKNTGDNAVQQEEVAGSVYRKLHISWDVNGENTELNGAYGAYPTDCEDTLVEYNHLEDASDAGIYVGKCGWADGSPGGGIVRYNVGNDNVVGMEVENSIDVVVHDNIMFNNSAGMISLQQPITPDKPKNTGILWHHNEIYCNNTPNFAATGIAAIVPPGSGAIVYSGDGQELCNNTFQYNDTGAVLIFSNYVICQADPPTDCAQPPGYIPYAINVYPHDNFYQGNGTNAGEPFTAFFLAAGVGTAANPTEDVFWDGYVYPDSPNGDPGICLGEDNTASFRSMTNNACQDIAQGDLGGLITCIGANNTTDTTGRLCTPPE